MNRGSIPPPDKVRDGEYEYDPVPMDEPSMPPNTFIHYFTKVTDAHNDALWVRRFPHRLKESIFYSPKPLAEGWGIEIAEGPNWLLFSIIMLLALLVSGTTAGLYGYFMKDTATGVAIGSWLTAVQALVVAILFFWRI